MSNDVSHELEYLENSLEIDTLLSEIDTLYHEQKKLEKNTINKYNRNIYQDEKENAFIFCMFRAILYYFPELKTNSNITIALWLTLYMYILLKMIQKNAYIR